MLKLLRWCCYISAISIVVGWGIHSVLPAIPQTTTRTPSSSPAVALVTQSTTASTQNPAPTQGPNEQLLAVKGGGNKMYLTIPMTCKSLTWGLKELGPRVTATYEDGDAVFLIPDGKGGFKKSKSCSYANGTGETIPATEGKANTMSFSSADDLNIRYVIVW